MNLVLLLSFRFCNVFSDYFTLHNTDLYVLFMGCQAEVVKSRVFSMSFSVLLVWHWSSRVTHLSIVAPWSCRMLPPPVNGFDGPSKPGEVNRGVWKHRWVRFASCHSYYMRRLTPDGTSGRDHMCIQRFWKRLQQVLWSALEHRRDN